MVRKWSVVAVLLLMTAACGTQVSNRQALQELRQDASARGVTASAGDAGGSCDGGTTDTTAASGEALGAAGVAPGPTSAATTPKSGSAGGTATTAGAAGATSTTAAGNPGARANTASLGGATDVGITDSEIRLGWVGTLTGPVPGLFRGALVGTNAFFNYQNSQGGIMGRQVKVISGDDSMDSGKNRAAHLGLKDKVFAFVGSFSINDDGGAAVVNDCGCPDVTGNLSQPMQNSQYHYGPQPQPLGWRSGPAKWYAQKFGPDVIQHWAFFVSQNAASEAIAASMRKVYERAGFKVVYTRTVPPNDNNQTADVVQMMHAGVRAISWEGDLGNMSKLANAMRQQNFTVDLANWGGSMYDSNTFKVTTPDALKNLYGDSTFAMFLGEDSAKIPEVKLFNDWMKKTDPSQPVDLFSLYGWMSARLFTDAMQKMAQAGTPPTRKALLSTLSSWGDWDGNGMIGTVNIGHKKPSDCFFLKTVTPDAKWTRIFPTDGRTYACDVGPFIRQDQLG
jgi:branched-chain amino acid transport system substrate-binding protein